MSQSRAHVIQFVKEISRAIVIKEMLVAKLIQELTRSRAKEKNHEIHESPRESTHSFAKAIVVARAYRQGTSSCSWAFTYSTYSFNAEVRSVNRKGKRRCAELFLCHDIADPSYERATLVSTARWSKHMKIEKQGITRAIS